MFPGAVNGAETFLTVAISESDTSITVHDAEGLLSIGEPFLLGLGGSAPNVETVKVTAVSGNILTVERGYQGEAQEWPRDTVAAVNFTEAHYRALVENIKALDKKKVNNTALQTYRKAVKSIDLKTTEHIDARDNPHGVTAAQIEAEPARALATQAQAEAGTSTTVMSWTAQRIRQAINAVTTAISDALTSHINARNNPHGVTADQVGAAPTLHRHDANVDSVVPEGLGIAAAGTSTIYARRDHVHGNLLDGRFILHEGRGLIIFRTPNQRIIPNNIITEIARIPVRGLSLGGHLYWFGRTIASGRNHLLTIAFQTRATMIQGFVSTTVFGLDQPTIILNIENRVNNSNYDAVFYAMGLAMEAHFYIIGAEFSNW